MKCKYCGGSGMTREDPTYCKHCKTHAGTVLSSHVTTLTSPISATLSVTIPELYKKLEFNQKAFVASLIRRYQNINQLLIEQLGQKLQSILDALNNNVALTKSLYINIPELPESDTFMYSFIKTCKSKNISVTSPIHLTELTYFTLYNREYFGEIMSVEYLILVINPIHYKSEDLEALYNTLEVRASKDLVTIIIGRYPADGLWKLFPTSEPYRTVTSSHIRFYLDTNYAYTKNQLVPIPSMSNYMRM